MVIEQGEGVAGFVAINGEGVAVVAGEAIGAGKPHEPACILGYIVDIAYDFQLIGQNVVKHPVGRGIRLHNHSRQKPASPANHHLSGPQTAAPNPGHQEP
jgi:hypothetical protein